MLYNYKMLGLANMPCMLKVLHSHLKSISFEVMAPAFQLLVCRTSLVQKESRYSNALAIVSRMKKYRTYLGR